MVYNYSNRRTDDSAGGCYFDLRTDSVADGHILRRTLMDAMYWTNTRRLHDHIYCAEHNDY